MRFCTLPGCERRHEALGLCHMHRWRLRNHGLGFDRSPAKQRADWTLRLPADPLLAVLDAHIEARRADTGLGWQSFARDHGIDPRQLYRWREHGSICLDHVDLVCDALGVHPAEVYGADYDEVVMAA